MTRTLTVALVIGIVMGSVLFAFAIGGVILGYGLKYHPDQTIFYTHLSLIIGQGAIVIPALIFLKQRKENLNYRFRLHPISLSTVFPVILLSIGIIFLSDELDQIMNIFLPIPDSLESIGEVLQLTSLKTALLIIPALTIIAPLGEEMLFRGFLQKFLEEHWQDITRAVLVSSLFFAFIHMNPYWIIQIYFLGVILGYLAWRTGSIIPSLILHGLNNGFALLASNIEQIESFYMFKGHVSPIILVFALIFVYFGFKWLHKSLETAQ